MKSVNLTPKQKKIFDFITSFYDKEGYAPSLAEIANKFKKSTTTIFQFVETLKEKGFLNKEPITVPKVMLSKSGLHYALKVKGNSMVDEGIYDGNTVIIRRQETATNGQKVVGLINGNEATLKKIYKEKNGFRLQPANSSMKPMIVKDLIIQGKFMGVLPNYEDRSKSITEVVQTPTQRQFELDRIITGDVLEVMAQIPDNSIHLAITSPPYNVGKNYDNHNDRMDYQQYLDWLETVWRETKRVLVPGGRFALNIAPTGIKNFVPIHHDFTNQMRKIG